MSKARPRKFVKLKRATWKSSLFSSIESGGYANMNRKLEFLSSESLCASVVSRFSITIVLRSQTPVKSNLVPLNRLPSFTPLTIMPAISLTTLFGYSFTILSIALTHESGSPLFRRVIPSRNIKRSLLSPSGKREAESSLLRYTSVLRSALKASYVAP